MKIKNKNNKSLMPAYFTFTIIFILMLVCLPAILFAKQTRTLQMKLTDIDNVKIKSKNYPLVEYSC